MRKKIMDFIAAAEWWIILRLGGELETISGRAARARNAGKQWGCVLCKILHWFDPWHCENTEYHRALQRDLKTDD